jgi:hypothetical protein
MKFKFTKKFFYLAATIALSIPILQGCKKPCDTIALADLFFTVAKFVEPKVELGRELVMQTILKNAKDECETEKANASERGIKAMYRPSTTAKWEPANFRTPSGAIVNEVIAPNNALGADATDNKYDKFTFSTPGYYLFIVNADVMDVVKERPNDNNKAEDKNGRVGGRSNTPLIQNSNYELMVEVSDPSNIIAPNYNHKNTPTVLSYNGSN